MAKQYNYNNGFEMLMIRHDYMRRVDNPDPYWVKKFEAIVKTTARIMYDKLKPNFNKVGYDLDDIESITNCYMIGYMGLYSIERNSDAKDKIVNSYKNRLNREPTEWELARKERTNLISFLRQRLQHAASNICSGKAKNITVGEDRRGVYAFTADSIPASQDLIYEDHSKFGYRKVSKDEFKQIKKANKYTKNKDYFDDNGFRVFTIELLNEGISQYDYNNLIRDGKTDSYNHSPESRYIHLEEMNELNSCKDKYKNMTIKEKKKLLNTFIAKHKGNSDYKRELSTANKMLKVLRSMV